MGTDFIANRVTVNHSLSMDVLLRYPHEEVYEMMENKVAHEFGLHAIAKSDRIISNAPGKGLEEHSFSCYIFSKRDLAGLKSYIDSLEHELEMLRSNMNRPWRL